MNKRSFTSPLLAVFLGLLSVSGPDLASLTLAPSAMEPIPPTVVDGSFVTAQASKRCMNICLARYRDCRSKGQDPPFICQNVYHGLHPLALQPSRGGERLRRRLPPK